MSKRLMHIPRSTTASRAKPLAHIWKRKGIMRVLTFDPYEKKLTDDGTIDMTAELPHSSMLFTVLHRSLYNPSPYDE